MNIADFLICQQCAQNTIEGASCTACGHQYETDDTTPCLFPTSDLTSFVVPYVSLERVKAALETALTRPQTAGAHSDVYHLDGAHLEQVKALPKGSVVLEVGCGGGQMRTLVEGLGHHYIGTDISKTRVHDYLRVHQGADFLSDVHHLPLRDACVDMVYSAAVTEHLAAPTRAVQEIYRVLKPGGIYLGNCSFMEPWHDESFFHISPNGAAALLLQAGFSPQAIWPAQGYSGYKALMKMGNRGTKAIAFLGTLMHRYSTLFYDIKRRTRGDAGYTDQAYLADIAITAGATDWIAKKPTQ